MRVLDHQILKDMKDTSLTIKENEIIYLILNFNIFLYFLDNDYLMS